MVAAVTRTDRAGQTYLHEWTLTTADGTGEAMSLPGASDRTLHAYGTWGGATLVLEGSNDPLASSWFNLTDGQGNAIAMSANAGETIAENTLWVRARLSVVGVGATVQVKLLSRSTMS